MITPSYKDLIKIKKNKKMIPICLEFELEDIKGFDIFKVFSLKSKKAFILENYDEDKAFGYSYIGKSPFAELIYKNDKNNDKASLIIGDKTKISNDVFGLLKEMNQRYQVDSLDSYSKFDMEFMAGGIGYFGYETFGLAENIRFSNSGLEDIADIHLMYFKCFVALDNQDKKIRCINLVDSNAKDFKFEYESRVKELRELKDEILEGLNIKTDIGEKQDNSKIIFKRNDDFESFKQKFERVKEYIRLGDIFQGVISSRFEGRNNRDLDSIYKDFVKKSPSSYTFCIDFEDYSLVGSSPETLGRLIKKDLFTCPIAGTRPRGKDEAEDADLETELLIDQKERAEHIMLVDLSRNDIGRLSEFDSVVVDKYMEIERYSHVMHIVSRVKGRIKEDLDMFDVIKGLIPAGTLSGAPKIRSVEIIEEVEDLRRGPYGGGLGYFSFNQNMDTCITIRTALIKDKTAYFQSGAGIVYDSKLESEFEETINKAKSVVEALGGRLDDTYNR